MNGPSVNGASGGAVVQAAGVVLCRGAGRHWRTLVLHRPHRRDWSLPKGKIDPGEHVLDAAVRECDEETGILPVLGVPLGRQEYVALGRPKTVDYWRAGIGTDNGFTPDEEVDEVRWASLEEARALLTYRRDVEFVERAHRLPPTTPLIVLRHAASVRRQDYSGPDAGRPLTGKGRTQARSLSSLLAAYGVTSVHTSDANRCVETLRPFLDRTRTVAELEATFTEPAHEARPAATAARVRQLAADELPALLCSHRPVLATILGELAEIASGRPRQAITSVVNRTLAAAGFVVLHRAIGPAPANRRIIATEVSQPRKGAHEVRLG